MVDDDTPRPSLETPRLFGRRKTARPDPTTGPAADESVFEDSGTAEPGTEVEADETAVLPVEARVRRPGARRGSVSVTDKPTEPTEPTEPARTRRAPRDTSTPLLPGRPAAALTGVLAGLALVGFTVLGFQGCEAVRGTSSCGTGPGMAALVVVMIATIVVGGVLLSFFKIPEPGSTSFLGTGLTGVVYLIVLVDRLEGWPTLVVIPAVSAATYLLSWWVTTTYVADE